MDSKKMIYLCMAIGSAIGGLIPMIWDSSPLSFSSVLFSAIGGFAGIVVGHKMTN